MSGEGSEQFRARDLTGNNVYTTNTYVEDDWDLDEEVTDIETAYSNIGEIEDLVLDADGKLIGIVAEVGGFLDIGDKHVMLPVEDLQVVSSAGEPYYVTRLTEEQLEELEGVDQGWWQ
jgi:rRNA processing protein Gar1